MIGTQQFREMEVRERQPMGALLKAARRPRKKHVTAREHHSKRELLDTAARETNVSSRMQETSTTRGAWETNVFGLRKMSLGKGAWETNMPRERLPLSEETEGR
jgi:hypothetical protein